MFHKKCFENNELVFVQKIKKIEIRCVLSIDKIVIDVVVI